MGEGVVFLLGNRLVLLAVILGMEMIEKTHILKFVKQ